jgi:transcriptional regulator with XRE-family HTH domain
MAADGALHLHQAGEQLRMEGTDAMSVTLPELLTLARELKGWSLRELMDKSGVHHALIFQMETGKICNPSFAKVVALSDALGLPLERCAVAIRAQGPKMINKGPYGYLRGEPT